VLTNKKKKSLPKRSSLQLRVLRLGLLQDGDVGVGVLPEGEEVLVAERTDWYCRLLHQSFECGASFTDLRQAAVRTLKVREKFLVFVDSLIALSGTFGQLAEIVVGEELNCRQA